MNNEDVACEKSSRVERINTLSFGESEEQKEEAGLQQNEMCTICLENIQNDCATLKCNHSFCISCFVQHSRLNNTCPLCRSEFSIKPKKQIVMSDLVRENLIEYISNKFDANTDTFIHTKRIFSNPDYYYKKRYEYFNNHKKLKRSTGVEKQGRIKTLYNKNIKMMIEKTISDVQNWYENN